MWFIIGMFVGSIIFIYSAVAYFVDLPKEPTPKQLTAEEIANEIAKKLPLEKQFQVGNLKERSIALADKIMEDLYYYGYPRKKPLQTLL